METDIHGPEEWLVSRRSSQSFKHRTDNPPKAPPRENNPAPPPSSAETTKDEKASVDKQNNTFKTLKPGEVVKF